MFDADKKKTLSMYTADLVVSLYSAYYGVKREIAIIHRRTET